MLGRASPNELPGCSVPVHLSLFYATLANSYHKANARQTATCLETVVGGWRGHAPCTILTLCEMLFEAI